jgi:hypothetical protein
MAGAARESDNRPAFPAAFCAREVTVDISNVIPRCQLMRVILRNDPLLRNQAYGQRTDDAFSNTSTTCPPQNPFRKNDSKQYIALKPL